MTIWLLIFAMLAYFERDGIGRVAYELLRGWRLRPRRDP